MPSFPYRFSSRERSNSEPVPIESLLCCYQCDRTVAFVLKDRDWPPSALIKRVAAARLLWYSISNLSVGLCLTPVRWSNGNWYQTCARMSCIPVLKAEPSNDFIALLSMESTVSTMY